MDKVLLINKPVGWTSFDVVAKIRGTVSKTEGRRIKVGHTGTLDPFATGLLIMLLGEFTKKQDTYMKLDKEYIATLKLGSRSSTGDPEGNVVITPKSQYKKPIRAAISKCLEGFIGEIKQIPPKHSAIKIAGKRAYKLAREGIDFELKVRKITIYSIKVLDYAWPKLILQVSCSSGTYVRTLAEDIGTKLGCGAYLTALQRTKIGDHTVDEAVEIDDIIKKLTKE
jgi:tRNA pseudouridine55 synthase